MDTEIPRYHEPKKGYRISIKPSGIACKVGSKLVENWGCDAVMGLDGLQAGMKSK